MFLGLINQFLFQFKQTANLVQQEDKSDTYDKSVRELAFDLKAKVLFIFLLFYSLTATVPYTSAFKLHFLVGIHLIK